jgi:hypothetical protein
MQRQTGRSVYPDMLGGRGGCACQAQAARVRVSGSPPGGLQGDLGFVWPRHVLHLLFLSAWRAECGEGALPLRCRRCCPMPVSSPACALSFYGFDTLNVTRGAAAWGRSWWAMHSGRERSMPPERS